MRREQERQAAAQVQAAQAASAAKAVRAEEKARARALAAPAQPPRAVTQLSMETQGVVVVAPAPVTQARAHTVSSGLVHVERVKEGRGEGGREGEGGGRREGEGGREGEVGGRGCVRLCQASASYDTPHNAHTAYSRCLSSTWHLPLCPTFCRARRPPLHHQLQWCQRVVARTVATTAILRTGVGVQAGSQARLRASGHWWLWPPELRTFGSLLKGGGNTKFTATLL